MRAAAVITAVLWFAPQQAAAQSYVSCTKTEQGQFFAARDRAEAMTLQAIRAIGPNRAFQRWFGSYTPKDGDVVRSKLKGILKALDTDNIAVFCAERGYELCDDSVFAFVDPEEHFLVFLCPEFFRMPTIKELDRVSLSGGDGTRAGTIIHEVSHFTVSGNTEDYCYGRDICSDMARRDPEAALENADSYQYFVEDVTYFGIGVE